MERRETYGPNGQLLAVDLIDLEAGTITREENGITVSTRALTTDEVARYTPATDRRAELLAQLDASPLMLDELRDALAAALTEGLI